MKRLSIVLCLLLAGCAVAPRHIQLHRGIGPEVRQHGGRHAVYVGFGRAF